MMTYIKLSITPPGDKIIMIGDLNATIGKKPGKMDKYGDHMTTFLELNNMRINNMFFNHPLKYKWQETTGILTKRAIILLNILEARIMNSVNIGSDKVKHKIWAVYTSLQKN